MGGASNVPAPGAVVGGRYTIERVVGRGGMGIVFAARDGQSGARVALKMMYEHDARSPVAVQRFDREARVAGRLSSEHVTRLIDLARTADGLPFMVMEFLDGEDLAKLLKSGRRVSVAEAALYIQQAALACSEAHAAGVIHRDIKPANLVVTRTRAGAPCVKLVDFGVSQLRGLSGTQGHQITAEGDITGSPLYMPPEQLRTRELDGRADVWALGATLYELLTGKRPFQAENMMLECGRILGEAPALPSKLAPRLPPGLDSVVLRCLEKDPAARYGSAAELAAALEPFAQTPTPTRMRTVVVLGVVIVVAALLGLAWQLRASARARGADGPAPPTTGAAP